MATNPDGEFARLLKLPANEKLATLRDRLELLYHACAMALTEKAGSHDVVVAEKQLSTCCYAIKRYVRVAIERVGKFSYE